VAGKVATLSIIEKVLILKRVGIFARTPDEILADVAPALEELTIPAGHTIVAKGDVGTSMYIIVSGRVRVHDGAHTLNELGERDVFGEMAVLDAAPRVASVTAIEETRLFRLEQGPLFDLMADRGEVARGIIAVLLGHLRARVRDVTQLQARLAELTAGPPQGG
jgi:CRP-like cAMP-binding protein